MSEIQRYEMISVTKCGEPWQELQPEPEGDYMLYSDHAAAIAAKDAELERFERNFGKRESHWIRENAQLQAKVSRLSGILTGATKEETVENILAASRGALNTRSVYILADELFSDRAK